MRTSYLRSHKPAADSSGTSLQSAATNISTGPSRLCSPALIIHKTTQRNASTTIANPCQISIKQATTRRMTAMKSPTVVSAVRKPILILPPNFLRKMYPRRLSGAGRTRLPRSIPMVDGGVDGRKRSEVMRKKAETVMTDRNV